MEPSIGQLQGRKSGLYQCRGGKRMGGETAGVVYDRTACRSPVKSESRREERGVGGRDKEFSI